MAKISVVRDSTSPRASAKRSSAAERSIWAANPRILSRTPAMERTYTHVREIPTDTSLYAGIAIAGDTAPHPRFLRGIWLSGANFALGPDAGNGSSMTRFYIRELRFDPTSTLFHLSSGRCANLGETTTLRGFDHTLDGVAFAGPVALENAQGINIGSSCTVPSLVENQNNSRYNSVHVQWRIYTPVWTQTTTAPSIGNGTITGNYTRAGHERFVNIQFVSGSTTTYGDGSSAYDLPYHFLVILSIRSRGSR